MDRHFIDSVFATPPAVLGRKLKPFCCGHAVILGALESAYMGGGDITPAELIVAVWVCSRSYGEGMEKLKGGKEAWEAECQEWGKSVMLFDFVKEHRLFNDYLETHIRAPERWKKRGGSSATKAPWPLSVATSLMTQLFFTEERAWNMPLQEALWYFAAFSDANGDKSLISEQERERLAAAKAAREKAKAEKAKGGEA